MNDAVSAANESDREEAYRIRLLNGLADVIRESGFKDAKVADVVRLARTSRRTFYEQFASLEDCYIALMQTENTRIVGEIAAAVDPHADSKVQIEQAITAWSRAAVAEPELMRSWIRDLAALGEVARDLQREMQESFVVLVNALTDNEDMRKGGILPPTRHTAIMLLGGLRELMTTAFEDGDSVDEVAKSATQATIALLELNRGS